MKYMKINKHEIVTIVILVMINLFLGYIFEKRIDIDYLLKFGGFLVVYLSLINTYRIIKSKKKID